MCDFIWFYLLSLFSSSETDSSGASSLSCEYGPLSIIVRICLVLEFRIAFPGKSGVCSLPFFPVVWWISNSNLEYIRALLVESIFTGGFHTLSK